MRVDKAFRPGVEAAQTAGWVLDHTKGGHLRLKPPRPIQWGDKMVTAVIFPHSASDKRSVKNFEADLKRSGLTW